MLRKFWCLRWRLFSPGALFRAGKGDIRGASRLAAFAFAVKTLEWLCTAHHVSALDEWNLFLGGVMWSGFVAALVWTAYLALEPYLRRYWPQSMISWSHLLSGGVRVPLGWWYGVIGAATAVGITFLYLVAGLLSSEHGPIAIESNLLNSVLDTRRMMGVSLSLPSIGVGVAMAFFLLFFLLRLLLRRQWLAVAAFILVLLLPNLASLRPPIATMSLTLLNGFTVFMLIRFGVLSVVVFPVVFRALTWFPMTTDFSTWYAGSTLFALALVLALTAYAFHTAVACCPLFKGGPFDTVRPGAHS